MILPAVEKERWESSREAVAMVDIKGKHCAGGKKQREDRSDDQDKTYIQHEQVVSGEEKRLAQDRVVARAALV